MKKCPNCGTLNNDVAKFCVNCGHDLSKISNQRPKSKTTQSQATPSREPFDNERQSNNMNRRSERPNYGKDVHNLLSDIKDSVNDNNGKQPWFKSLNGVLAAVIVLLIIIVIELGIAIGDLSDIDDTVGAHNNDQGQNDSYVIHHQHKSPKLYINHHETRV